MIQVKIKREQISGIIHFLSVSGHSAYAEKGSDIVCSAVSALVQTAYAVFITHFSSNIKHSDNGKCFTLEIGAIEPEKSDQIIGYCDFLMTGLLLIEKNYSDYIKIIILEE